MGLNFKKHKLDKENSETQINKGLNSNFLPLESKSDNFDAYYYEALKYMFVCFFDICACEIPANSSSYYKDLMQFNYCVDGRIELALEDGFNVCLKEDDFCLSKQITKTPFFFPTKNYKGVTIYFDEKKFSLENAALLSLFELDFQNVSKKHLHKQNTVILQTNSELRNVIKTLWQNRENLSNFKLKHSALEIINILLNFKVSISEKRTYHTKTQAEIAKRAEKLLTKNISERIPIKTVAEKFGISETSLKNYFKAVFGENISEYLRKHRMEQASKMLKETKPSVGEISHLIGYTKQGKFAELFRKYYGHSPLEYRRAKFLEEKTLITTKQ